MKENKAILMSSPEAAQIKTVTGWVSRTGRFWGDDEAMARYDGATHKECENNPEHPIIKINSYCEICAHERRLKKFSSFEKVEWDEHTPIHNFFGDEYFFSFDELIDYCVENDTDLLDLHLVLTEPCYIKQFDIIEHVGDDAVEDWDANDLSPELRAAIDNLNELIKKEPPISYFPTNKAIIFNETQVKTVLEAISENNIFNVYKKDYVLVNLRDIANPKGDKIINEYEYLFRINISSNIDFEMLDRMVARSHEWNTDFDGDSLVIDLFTERGAEKFVIHSSECSLELGILEMALKIRWGKQ